MAASIVECLERAGAERADSTDDVAFYFLDAARGNVDKPAIAGTDSFSLEVLGRSGTVPEEGDGAYRIFVFRSSADEDRRVSEIIEGGRGSAVVYFQSPTRAQIRAAGSCVEKPLS